MSDVFLPEFLTGRAVWWVYTGTDRFGDYTYGEPVEVRCRWDDIAAEYLDEGGARRISNAMVMVDRDMKPGGMLWNGTLEGLTDPGVPENNEGARKIERFEKSPDPDKGRKFVRTAIL